MRNFIYIPQTNGYNCGAIAVMNAFNYHYEDMFDISDDKLVEKILNTDPIEGTHEKYMIKELRDSFTVKMERSFSKKKIDNWISKSEDHQVIILYCYDTKGYQWHYANIFEKKYGRYWGANFWTPSVMGVWRFTVTLPEDYVKKFYRQQADFITMYIKPR